MELQIGDRIRVYETPFYSPINYSSYKEGLVVSEKNYVKQWVDILIDKVVFNGKTVVKTSWLYGHTMKGIATYSEGIELLTPQMKLIF